MSSAGNPGDMTRVLGWGAIRENGPSSDQLLRVDVPIISNAECSRNYGGGITGNMICAGYEQGGKDSCQGDSGGPLVITHDGQYYQAGVVSFGNGCAQAGYPGVYARVEKYIDWINGYIGGVNPPPPGDSELTNGTPVTGLTGARGDELQYTVKVPAGARDFTISSSGGSGDADLYVKFGSTPTNSSYDCRPYVGGNTEKCTISNVQAGTYFVMLKGYSSFSDVSLVAKYTDTGEPGPGPEPSEDLELSDLSGSRGAWLHYEIDVPAGASRLRVKIFGGNGDADLYVLYGDKPTRWDYDCKPNKNGNDEKCVIRNPQQGTWHIALRGYRNFNGVNLTATLE